TLLIIAIVSAVLFGALVISNLVIYGDLWGRTEQILIFGLIGVAIIAATAIFLKLKTRKQFLGTTLGMALVASLIAAASVTIAFDPGDSTRGLPNEPSFNLASAWKKVDTPAKHNVHDGFTVKSTGVSHCHVG